MMMNDESLLSSLSRGVNEPESDNTISLRRR